jgi:hypothetical protein
MREAIKYKGVEMEVIFDYTPEEPSTHDYPGCGAETCINEVIVKGVDIFELLDHELEQIEDYLYNNYNY